MGGGWRAACGRGIPPPQKGLSALPHVAVPPPWAQDDGTRCPGQQGAPSTAAPTKRPPSDGAPSPGRLRLRRPLRCEGGTLPPAAALPRKGLAESRPPRPAVGGRDEQPESPERSPSTALLGRGSVPREGREGAASPTGRPPPPPVTAPGPVGRQGSRRRRRTQPGDPPPSTRRLLGSDFIPLCL